MRQPSRRRAPPASRRRRHHHHHRRRHRRRRRRHCRPPRTSPSPRTKRGPPANGRHAPCTPARTEGCTVPQPARRPQKSCGGGCPARAHRRTSQKRRPCRGMPSSRRVAPAWRRSAQGQPRLEPPHCSAARRKPRPASRRRRCAGAQPGSPQDRPAASPARPAARLLPGSRTAAATARDLPQSSRRRGGSGEVHPGGRRPAYEAVHTDSPRQGPRRGWGGPPWSG
mmetsp:Transcript_43831/g.145118  ORF Transcript_43831/g.145118 Transcript_43831/m.145118 type:complete len:225 (-) Transcript_43831:814-1488(-)